MADDVRSRSRRRRWPIWVLVVAVVVAIGLFIAQDPRTVRVRSAHGAADPLFPDYVASLVGAPVTHGDRYRVRQNGDEIYPAMLAAIDAARRRVAFESFNFIAGEAADRFLASLTAAARRGVVVRVVLDAVGAVPPPARLEERLREAGVEVAWFNPFGIWTFEYSNYRTHRKLLIVDGQVAFTGGAGVADHWLGHAQDEDHWRDSHFEITGPTVRLLEACFYENWVESGGVDPPELDLHESPGPSGARSIVIWSNTTGGVSNVKLLYLYSIAGARTSIDIQSPYFILDSSVRWALADARARGVRIRILTDGDITDAQSVKHASRHEYQNLLDDGTRLFEYRPTMMHVKLMVIDGVWTVFGSANFDNRSLELNDEITLAVADRELSASLLAAFERDLQQSEEITSAAWRQRPWHRRLREQFWGMFGEIF
jgi:cardiolipin synthase